MAAGFLKQRLDYAGFITRSLEPSAQGRRDRGRDFELARRPFALMHQELNEGRPKYVPRNRLQQDLHPADR